MFFCSLFDVRNSPLFFPIFHNSLVYFSSCILFGIGLSRNQTPPKRRCPSRKLIYIWVSFHCHLALFIEYKASSLTLSHETLPLLLFAASAFAPPPNQFLCKSRFVFARCVSITTSAICVFLWFFWMNFCVSVLLFFYWIRELLFCFLDRFFSSFALAHLDLLRSCILCV